MYTSTDSCQHRWVKSYVLNDGINLLTTKVNKLFRLLSYTRLSFTVCFHVKWIISLFYHHHVYLTLIFVEWKHSSRYHNVRKVCNTCGGTGELYKLNYEELIFFPRKLFLRIQLVMSLLCFLFWQKSFMKTFALFSLTSFFTYM